MTKHLFINSTYMSLAVALDEAHSANGEILDWAMNSRYAQEKVWVTYRLNKACTISIEPLLLTLYDTYMNSLLKRDVAKSVEMLLRKVNIPTLASSMGLVGEVG